MTSVTVSVQIPKVDKKALESFSRDIAEFAVKKIRSLAQMAVHSEVLKQAYTRSLDVSKNPDVIVLHDRGATVTLVKPQKGLDPNMLEGGAGPWDMKPGLLGGKKYKDILFRHGAPGSSGAYASTMSADVKKDINSAAPLGRMKPSPLAPTSTSGMVGSIKQMLKRTGRAEGVESVGKSYPGGTEKFNIGPKSVTSYQHKTGIHSDMLKMSQQYETAKGTQYATIRRVSLKSDAGSWIHPGWTALHLFEKAVPDVQKYMNAKAAALFKISGG